MTITLYIYQSHLTKCGIGCCHINSPAMEFLEWFSHLSSPYYQVGQWRLLSMASHWKPLRLMSAFVRLFVLILPSCCSILMICLRIYTPIFSEYLCWWCNIFLVGEMTKEQNSSLLWPIPDASTGLFGSRWLVKFNTSNTKLLTFHHHLVDSNLSPFMMMGLLSKRILALNTS